MKKAILSILVAVGLVGSASAQTVYITGSTAFRSVVNSSLYNQFSNNLAATTSANAYDTTASALLYTNITINGSTIDLSVSWSGSEAGIRTVASPASNTVNVSFYDATKVKGLGGLYPKTSLTLAGANQITTRGDIAFSDTWQAVSNFQGKAKDGRTYASLSEVKVGVVPFTFIANKGTTIDNITVDTANQLARSGRIPASMLTGEPSNVTGGVWLTGRDPFSGTRVTTLSVTKVGYNTAIKQYKPTATNGAITSIGDYSTNNISGFGVPSHDNGEASGATLTSYMTNSMATNVGGIPVTINGRGTTNILVSYANTSDVILKYTNGLVPLKYNGVNGRFGLTNEWVSLGATNTALDSGYYNIINGIYPFWSYEHIMWDPTRMSSSASNVVTWLTNQISGFSSTSPELTPNIKLSDMRVYRKKDGGSILYSTNPALYR